MPANASPVPDQPETRLESVEEIRKLLGAKPPGQPGRKEAGEGDTVPFRPLRRPPQAMLCALDDGSDDGEWLRIRGDKFVIGRAEGDLIIPHEALMSGRHAEIARLAIEGGYRWFLTDLGSKNGTFVRVGRAVVGHGQEILLGSRRFRVSTPPPGAQPTGDANDGPKETAGWQSLPGAILPALVEVTAEGEGQRFILAMGENWLGRDPGQCNLVLGNDPLLNPRHARLARDPRGRWQLENAGSRNGVWVRVQKIPLDASAHFQLGEQRFVFKILSGKGGTPQVGGTP